MPCGSGACRVLAQLVGFGPPGPVRAIWDHTIETRRCIGLQCHGSRQASIPVRQPGLREGAATILRLLLKILAILRHGSRHFPRHSWWAPCPTLSHPVPPCPTLSHPVPPCPTLSHPVPPCPTLSHPVPPCPTLPHPVPPCPTLPHPVPPCPTLSHPVPPCPTLPHPVPPCPTLSHPAPPCPTLSHPVPPCPTLSHPVPPCPTLSHPVPPCPTLSHPVPPCPTLSHQILPRGLGRATSRIASQKLKPGASGSVNRHAHSALTNCSRAPHTPRQRPGMAS